MRIVTDRHFTGFSVRRLETASIAPWVNIYLRDGNGETGDLIELNSAAECRELAAAAAEAERLLTPDETAGEVSS